MAPATTNASQGESVTLGKAVQSTIQSTLAIVSAETFLNITLEMLNNNQDEVFTSFIVDTKCTDQ
jgi:hypothetical protein